jgi:hypothetical protein
VWGGARRVYASFKFFLYTLLGSVLMLLAMMAMYWHAGTTDIPTLLTYKFPARHAVVAVARLLRLLRRSSCRCGRCITWLPTRMWRRRRRAPGSSPASF